MRGFDEEEAGGGGFGLHDLAEDSEEEFTPAAAGTAGKNGYAGANGHASGQAKSGDQKRSFSEPIETPAKGR